MTWVLWDILVPLLTSFGLGTLLGWLLWRWRRQSVETDTMAAAGFAGTDSDMNVSEIEAANVVLIQERDSAIVELESLRSETEVLHARVTEMESNSQEKDSESATDVDSDHPLQAANVEIKTEQQAEKIVELEQKLEQITVACQEERKVKRELELELLNTKNHYEKLEADKDDSGNAVPGESERANSEKLRTEFETLEVNHAKLQSVFEEQKRSAISANKTIEEKEAEISQLQASLVALQSSGTEPDEQQQETSAHDVQIDQSQAQQQTDEKEPLDASEKVSGNSTEPLEQHCLAGVEMSIAQDAGSNATKSGYVPQSWSVPDVTPAKNERDQLTEIKGVGPVLEKLLHQSGIFYFQQVASLDNNGINELQEQIPQFPNRIRRDQWVKQAKKLHRDKYGATA